jgi:hypothetical protein
VKLAGSKLNLDEGGNSHLELGALSTAIDSTLFEF